MNNTYLQGRRVLNIPKIPSRRSYNFSFQIVVVTQRGEYLPAFMSEYNIVETVLIPFSFSPRIQDILVTIREIKYPWASHEVNELSVMHNNSSASLSHMVALRYPWGANAF
jgi:hypothetical protein